MSPQKHFFSLCCCLAPFWLHFGSILVLFLILFGLISGSICLSCFLRLSLPVLLNQMTSPAECAKRLNPLHLPAFWTTLQVPKVLCQTLARILTDVKPEGFNPPPSHCPRALRRSAPFCAAFRFFFRLFCMRFFDCFPDARSAKLGALFGFPGAAREVAGAKKNPFRQKGRARASRFFLFSQGPVFTSICGRIRVDFRASRPSR